MLNKMNGYFDEITGDKYLTLVLTNKSKEKEYEKCVLKSEI